MKFWRKNKAAISGTLLFILGIGAFIGLGYYYSNSNVGYDYVGVGPAFNTLNYNTGTGEIYRITALTNEGLISPSADFKKLQAEVAATDWKTFGDANGLTSVEEYHDASKIILENRVDEYKKDESSIDSYNENERLLIILASGGEEDLDKAAKILTHYRPMTYIGDDAEEVAQLSDSSVSPQWLETSNRKFSAFSYGVADAIYTNEDFSSYRFRLRDGSYSDDVAKWQSWDGHEADRVSASDVAFGISRQVPSTYGSAGRYMYTSILGVKGSADITQADKDSKGWVDGRTKFNGHDIYSDIINNSGSIQDRAEEAVMYGLPPDDDARNGAFRQDKGFESFGSTNDGRNNVGVVYHDPVDYEDGEVPQTTTTGDYYSYIDFNLENGSDTFATMMSSTGLWPVNWEWFFKVVGEPTFDNIQVMGSKAKYTLSNSAQQIETFDSLYGYTTKKNPNYYDEDLVTVEDSSFRMITEPSTQVSMFANGDASYVIGGDSNTKSIMDDEESTKWLKDKFTKPANKFLFFNLGADRIATDGGARREHAQWTSDPNFRRAITYAFNTNDYHEFSSTPTANPVSSFQPVGMYTDASGTDFANYMTDINFKNKGTEDTGYVDTDTDGNEIAGKDSESLEYYTLQDRQDVLSNPIDFETAIDPTQHYELADYYFNIFLDDMKQLNVTVPPTMELDFLTSIGANDPFAKAFQATVEQHDFSGHKIKLVIDQVPTGVFFQNYYGADYDIATIQWSADYLDPWSNMGIFNMGEYARGNNATGGWNFWDGSDYTFTDDLYDDPALARSLFNDGFRQFYEDGGAKANLTSVEYSQDLSKYNGKSIIEGDAQSDFVTVGKKLWEAALSDNNIKTWDEDTPIAYSDYDGVVPESQTSFGLNYNAHTSEIWGDPKQKMEGNILFELILKDGASSITGTTESRSISPSRAMLESDPVLGYETRTFSFDLYRIKGFWNDVEKQIKDEFYK